MAFSCLLGHSWKGCKCSKCGKLRDVDHDWKEDCEKCSICNKTRNINHAISDCECDKCRFNREELAKLRSSMILVEGGTFEMGSTDGYDNEEPVHNVTLSSFRICAYVVTQELWRAIMGSRSKIVNGLNLPVVEINWNDCLVFCNRLSIQEGLTPVYSLFGSNDPHLWGAIPGYPNYSNSAAWKDVKCDFNANGYRMPTEAEWEFAARGGIKSRGFNYSGSNTLDSVAWHFDNSGKVMQPVMGLSANELGAFDMSGNVWEWCWDWLDNNYYKNSPSINPTGWSMQTGGNYRVIRGGSYQYGAKYCRVSMRYGCDHGMPMDNIGLRLVRTEGN